jgi:lactoylglutathione lyase
MGTDDVAAFNHIGLCVTDLDRARRFYEGALGVRYLYEMRPPTDVSSRLVMLDPPMGSTIVFLRPDGLVLELMPMEYRRRMAAQGFWSHGRPRPPRG